MKLITAAANRVAGRLRTKLEKQQFNPLLILALIGVIVDAIRLWWDCRKNWSSPSEAALRGRPLLRERLRRKARRRLATQGLDESLDVHVVEAALEELGVMSDQDIHALVEEYEQEGKR